MSTMRERYRRHFGLDHDPTETFAVLHMLAIENFAAAEVSRKSSVLRELMDAADEMLEQPIPEDAIGAARVGRLSQAILAAARSEEKG